MGSPLLTHLLPGARAKGFTLIELMMVVAIGAILATLAAPSMRDLILKNRLRGAAEEAQSMLQLARSEAVKRNADVYVSFTDGAAWCFGTSTATNCDCTNTTSCVVSIAGSDVLKRVVSTDYTDVTLTSNPANHEVQFDSTRGLTTSTGTMTFTNGGFEIRVIVSVLGRAKMCSPSGTAKVWGYEDC